MSQFPLYLKNGEDLSCQTSQSFFFLLPYVKRSPFQNKLLAFSQFGFSGPQSFQDFQETGPRESNRLADSQNVPLLFLNTLIVVWGIYQTVINREMVITSCSGV